jgi:hypothetical protein
MNKAIATVCFAFFAILIYMGWVVTSYKPEQIVNTTGAQLQLHLICNGPQVGSTKKRK